jgi:hypothetical protein
MISFVLFCVTHETDVNNNNGKLIDIVLIIIYCVPNIK